MNTGAQIEADWIAIESVPGGAATPPASSPNGTGTDAGAYLTDEEILGIDPIGTGASKSNGQSSEAENPPSTEHADALGTRRDSSGEETPRNDNAQVSAAEHQATGAPMPAWMQTLARDPQHGVEARQLWQEHQAFRAAFSSPEEARAIKELFPGGVQDARTLRQASQAVDQIDAAIYSGDARAQSEVVAELARANPAAFRSLFAEAAKVLSTLSGNSQVAASTPGSNDQGYNNPTQAQSVSQQSPATNHPSLPLRASESQGTHHAFDPAAYASFERSTNDFVAREVRAAVADTLTRVLPEGVAEGAARRIGDDIFNEIHRTLAADRTLSEQVGEVLRERRFGSPEQQRVESLLTGRAKQLVPGVSRRVIGEWTSSVLGTSRNKAARQAAAASRVDIAAPGGSRDSAPLRPMSPRAVNYASMSDDEILSL
jgi:hypothetical protein